MRYLSLLLFIFLSCNDSANTESDKNKDSVDSKTPAMTSGISGCYLQVMARDTFAAQIIQEGNRITGKLTFDNFEKDGSTGTIDGTIENDIIHVHYSFASEGMNSVMEIYFKAAGDSLIRGIGEMDVKGDSAYFKNSNIQYDGPQVLKKTDCDKLDEKYK